MTNKNKFMKGQKKKKYIYIYNTHATLAFTRGSAEFFPARFRILYGTAEFK
jgi:hypothetical protein